MSNVIDFKKPNQTPDKNTIKMWNLAKDIDFLVVEAISDGVSPIEVAAILCNRFKAACDAASAATGKEVLTELKNSVLDKK